MPCHTTLFNDKAEPLYQFGAAHRNTISWSPHGRFLVIAGLLILFCDIKIGLILS